MFLRLLNLRSCQKIAIFASTNVTKAIFKKNNYVFFLIKKSKKSGKTPRKSGKSQGI